MEKMSDVRQPAVAGLFYSGSKDQLKSDVENLLAEARNKKRYDNVFAIIAPHAGYIYSGKTAAYAYNTIKGKDYTRVIVLSPSHREYFQGNSVYFGDAYKTPLGEIEIDKEFRDKIINSGSTIFSSSNGHKEEHALEVHLPFLQSVLSDFKLVPIVMGNQSEASIADLAKTLAENVDDKTLIVASTDLSHFYSKKKTDELNSLVEECINNFDYEKLFSDLEFENCHACGGGLVVTALKAASLCGRTNAEVLNRSDSGDVTGDPTEVVGYLSAVIY